jgi:hypothetical protein
MSKSNIFFSGIIAVLVVIILLQRACSPKCKSCKDSIPGTIYKTEVEYIPVDNVVTKEVKLIKHDTVRLAGDSVFVPAPGYKELKGQYEDLVRLYSARNIYSDTLKLDSLGFIAVSDTLQYNTLKNRTYNYSYKIPVVTNYVQSPPRRQVYIGGGISMNALLVPQAQAGLLYKNKRDQIFGAYVGVNTLLIPSYGVSSYWKISLRKK